LIFVMQPTGSQITPGTGAPWVMNFSSGVALPLGTQVAFLLVRMSSWIHRRVESIEFLDDVNVRRRVSVDFTVPRNVQPITDLDGRLVSVAPIALLSKERLPRFDFRDEADDAIPLLRADEDSLIYSEALTRICEGRINRQLEEEVREAIRRVARAEKDEAQEAREWFSRAGGGAMVSRRLLAADPVVNTLLDDAARNFPVLVSVEWPQRNGKSLAPERRILKFAFDEEIPDDRSGAKLLQSLGWRTRRARVGATGVGDAASYHFGVAAPVDIEIVGARLAALDPPIRRFITLDDSGKRSTTGAHLMVRGAAPRSEGIALIQMRVRRAGLLRASALTTAFIAAVLTVGALRLAKLDGQSSDVDVLLVAIPGLLAIYLARPGEHILASRLLVGVRMVVALSGLLAFVAAGSLVALGPGRVEASSWFALAGAAWLLAGCALLSYVLPRRGRRE
jgi:hypothetical protein